MEKDTEFKRNLNHSEAKEGCSIDLLFFILFTSRKRAITLQFRLCCG